MRVLDADPELAAHLPAEEREAARTTLVAHSYEMASGPWTVPTPAASGDAFGLLVTDGALGLRTSLEDRATLELVGPGDLLQPWVQLDPAAIVSPSARWEVVQPSRLLVLDSAVARSASAWPEIAAALMHRLVLRSRRLVYQLTANSSPRAEERLLYTFWALADRWGRVTENGLEIRLPLTHRHLAELTSVQRPSVSTALGRLRAEGRLSYTRDLFVLHGSMPAEVEELRAQAELAQP